MGKFILYFSYIRLPDYNSAVVYVGTYFLIFNL